MITGQPLKSNPTEEEAQVWLKKFDLDWLQRAVDLRKGGMESVMPDAASTQP